jgi:alkyl hydroperoxide reductase subunit AhpF
MTSTDPVRITVVTAAACHFCDDAQAAIAELAQAYPLTVRHVAADSADGQALLHAQRAGMFPLVLVNGAYFSAGRLPRRKLERLLSHRAPAAVRAR